jgi:hypothetical protein
VVLLTPSSAQSSPAKFRERRFFAYFFVAVDKKVSRQQAKNRFNNEER